MIYTYYNYFLIIYDFFIIRQGKNTSKKQKIYILWIKSIEEILWGNKTQVEID